MRFTDLIERTPRAIVTAGEDAEVGDDRDEPKCLRGTHGGMSPVSLMSKQPPIIAIGGDRSVPDVLRVTPGCWYT